VNDGSSDHTISVLQGLRKKDSRIAILDLSRNFGKEIAMTAGLDYAHGDAIVVIDADLQDPPELIHEFLKHWQEGNALNTAHELRHSNQPDIRVAIPAKAAHVSIEQSTDRIR
jgi:glycosyltransferase involved in cell wall biosynthesis